MVSASISSPQPGSQRQRSAWRRLRRVVAWSLMLLGALIVIVTVSPLDVWWARRLSGPFDAARGDVLIVLAEADTTDEFIPYGSYLRAQYAVRAWQQGGFRSVAVLGGGSKVPASVSVSDLLKFHGVPATAIELETSSTTTRENAIFAKGMLEQLPGTKVLLTSDYHMYRAKRVFARAGIPVTPMPFPDAVKRAQSWRGRWPAFLDLATESVKIGYYELRGWM